MEKTCIVQIDIHPKDVNPNEQKDIAIKRYHKDIIRHSKQTMMDYARALDADYFCYHKPIFHSYHPQLEIFRIFDIMYDYIMVADVDVIVNTHDNIFDYCKIDKLNYKHRCAEEIRRYGEVDFNSGVVVFGKDVIPILMHEVDLDRANKWEQRDQSEMWHIMQYLDIGHRLPEKFNTYLNFNNLDGLLHFKGGKKKQYEELKEKLNYPDIYKG